MIRLTGAAFLIALTTTLISGRTAEAQFSSGVFTSGVIDAVTKAIEQLMPLITKAQIEGITSQLDKMDDASLYLLRAAPDACKVLLVRLKCEGA
jgi:hypothetical protein